MVGRPPKYPWQDWFAALERGSTVSVIQGRDFTHAPEHMRSQIMLQARNRGLSVKTTWLPRASRLDVRLIRRQRYDWDHWLDGQVHEILPTQMRGKTLSEFAAIIRQTGRRRGLVVRTHQRHGKLYIQAFKREASPVG